MLDWVQFPEHYNVLTTTATVTAEAETDYVGVLSSFLSTADAIIDLSYDPVNELLAVANGDHVDIVNPVTGLRVYSLDIGATVTKISAYGGSLWAATATQGKYYDDYAVDSSSVAGGAGLVDGLIWSTAEDSNPAWSGAVYTPPLKFLLEADGTGWEVWDLATGAPVTDLTEVKAGLSSITYAEGAVLVGTSTGSTEYDWAVDVDTNYTTATSPAIVDNAVNDVALTVLDSAPERDATTGLLYATKAWATDAGVSVGVGTGDVWDITGQTTTVVAYVDFTGDGKVMCPNLDADGWVYDVPASDRPATAFERRYFNSTSSVDDGAPKINRTAGAVFGVPMPPQSLAYASAQGLTTIVEDVSIDIRVTSDGATRITSAGDTRRVV